MDLPNYVNKMNGDRMDISFDLGRMKIAEVNGNAESLVFNITPSRKVDGKNESTGKSILIAFDSTQVSKIMVKGNMASGIYYDMSKMKKNPKDSLPEATTTTEATKTNVD